MVESVFETRPTPSLALLARDPKPLACAASPIDRASDRSRPWRQRSSEALAATCLPWRGRPLGSI
eukprot:9474651-Pyramimonas_sp.AAC.2